VRSNARASLESQTAYLGRRFLLAKLASPVDTIAGAVEGTLLYSQRPAIVLHQTEAFVETPKDRCNTSFGHEPMVRENVSGVKLYDFNEALTGPGNVPYGQEHQEGRVLRESATARVSVKRLCLLCDRGPVGQVVHLCCSTANLRAGDGPVSTRQER
jgi:hypothetical protein